MNLEVSVNLNKINAYVQTGISYRFTDDAVVRKKKRIHCQQTKFTLYTRNTQHDFEELTYHFSQFNKNESSHI